MDYGKKYEGRPVIRLPRCLSLYLPLQALGLGPVYCTVLTTDDTMFKKFTQEADVKSLAREKSSKARKILSAIREQYSDLEEVLEELFPDKKTPVTIATCKDRTELLVRNGQPIFYKPRDGPWVPTLKFLYQYPGCMKVVRVDKGAIRFVLRGAAVACGGLKQETSDLPDGLEVGDPVALYAEGKHLPLAVGIMVMSTEEIMAAAKGFAIEQTHFLDDALWKCSELE